MKTAREILFKYYKIWHKSIFKESPEQDMYEQFIESSSTYAEKAMEEYLILGQIKVLEELKQKYEIYQMIRYVESNMIDYEIQELKTKLK